MALNAEYSSEAKAASLLERQWGMLIGGEYPATIILAG